MSDEPSYRVYIVAIVYLKQLSEIRGTVSSVVTLVDCIDYLVKWVPGSLFRNQSEELVTKLST